MQAVLLGTGSPPPNPKRRGPSQPEDLGRVAAGARARKLAVTHLMPGSEPRELETAARRHYAGPLVVGGDLLEV